MKLSDRSVLLGLGVVLLTGIVWFMLISPKRDEAAQLDARVDQLRTSISQHEQTIAYGEQARQEFPRTYQHLVVLGKAVPAGEDSSAMLIELSSIAAEAGVEFRGITLADTEAASTPAPAPPPPPAEGESSDGDTGVPAESPALATETVAANLPIGASLGPAGLPVMPYELRFAGDFFDVADFLAGVDRLVSSDGSKVVVDGRLMTIDGFALTSDTRSGFPRLDAAFALTAYATPSQQGVTVGATPSGPAPAADGDPPGSLTASTVTP